MKIVLVPLLLLLAFVASASPVDARPVLCDLVPCEYVDDTAHVCVAGTTEPSCYRFRDICVEISDMVPICMDNPVKPA